MGSVDAVGGSSLAAQLASTQSTGTQGVQGGHRHHHHAGAIDSAAKALGMAEQDVSSALKSGKSLDDLAQEKGISHDDLVSAIKAGLPTGSSSRGRRTRSPSRSPPTAGRRGRRHRRPSLLPPVSGGTPSAVCLARRWTRASAPRSTG